MEAYKSENARYLDSYRTGAVRQRQAQENVTGEQRDFDQLAAVSPTPHFLNHGKKYLNAGAL
jgi:hypothetical protein